MLKSGIGLQNPATRLILHGDARARAAVQAVWGVGFSDRACRAVAQANRATLWLGPDEYLLWYAVREPDFSSAALEEALAGIPHALVDVSHRQIALEVCGDAAATILSAACPLDLDLAEFPVHMCTRTVFAKADVVLWRTAPDRFHMEVWRSFAPYVMSLLDEICLEFSAAP